MEFGEDGEDVVADAGNNADLYAANQGSTELIKIKMKRTRRRPRYVSWVKTRLIFSRLVSKVSIRYRCRQVEEVILVIALLV